MIDPTVSKFFAKNPGEGYAESYRADHGPRLQAMIDRYGLKQSLAGKRVVDVGGGLGFLGELLDPSTDYWVIDGADVKPEQRVAKGEWFRADLDHDQFGSYRDTALGGPFDTAFCLETLEHLQSPVHCLLQIKRLVKEGGLVYLSVPSESVWHNTPNPFTFWPPQHFEVFLAQLALPVRDFYVYQPKERGWPAYQFLCENRPHREKRMIYAKDDPKFLDCDIVAATNL